MSTLSGSLSTMNRSEAPTGFPSSEIVHLLGSSIAIFCTSRYNLAAVVLVQSLKSFKISPANGE
jgi:hypothetical protein